MDAIVNITSDVGVSSDPGRIKLLEVELPGLSFPGMDEQRSPISVLFSTKKEKNTT
jgi:hypothetical protein